MDIDPTFVQVVKSLYGEDVDPRELWKSMPDQSSVHVNGEANANKRRKRIAAGLALGTAAESAGTAHAIHGALKAYKDPHVPKFPKFEPGFKGAFRALSPGKSKSMAVADAGLQAVNLGIGLAATHELMRHQNEQKTESVAKPVVNRQPKKVTVKKGYKARLVESNLEAARKGRRTLIGTAAVGGVVGGYAATDAAKRHIGRLRAVAVPKKQQLSSTPPGQVAVKKRHEDDLVWEGEISKVDPDKRLVFGWCSLSKVNGEPVVDLQGDYLPIEETENAAYRYVIESRKGGDMHRRVQKFDQDEPLHTADLVESMVFTPEKLEKMGLPPDALPEGWWIGMKVNDDAQWAAVKDKKRLGFSIHGKGRRVEKAL